jgi:hypothetical protein
MRKHVVVDTVLTTPRNETGIKIHNYLGKKASRMFFEGSVACVRSRVQDLNLRIFRIVKLLGGCVVHDGVRAWLCGVAVFGNG